MNVGLLYTPVSIYQMTRGALILFVAALSVIFLRRRLWLYQLSILPHSPTWTPTFLYKSFINPVFPQPRWVSLVTVMGGVSLVGYSGSLIKESVKEPLLSLLSPSDGRLGLDGAVSPRAASDQPEGVRVLIGARSLPPYGIFLPTLNDFAVQFRYIFRLVCPGLVSIPLFPITMPLQPRFTFLSRWFTSLIPDSTPIM